MRHKLGALSTLISSVVIGAVGLWATTEYNAKQLAVSQLEQKQASEIELTKQLEDLFPYLSSDDTNKRKFGYAMFVALGRETLALSLMGANNDPAGQPIAASLTTSTNHLIAAQAMSVNSSLKLNAWLVASPAATGVGNPPISPAPTGGGIPTLNPDRVNALQQWVGTHSVIAGLKDVPVEALLNSPDPKLAAVRGEAIRDLGIKSLAIGASP